MTVREYVGARYVPLFMGDWDIDADYEPLSIVQYQGNSYTSRQAVPHGVDIANEQYWANTGNYNAQIEAYRQEVAAYNARIAAVENGLPVEDFDSENTVSDAIDNALAKLPGTSFDSVNTVKKYIDDAIGDIADEIGTGFSVSNTIAGNILNLKNRISGFKNANVLCIADSWGSEGVNGVTKCWMRLVCESLEANYIDLHAGSTGWLAISGSNGNFLQRLQDYVNDNPTTQIDYIFVCGGVNDYQYTSANIASAISNFMNWVAANLPNTFVYHFQQFTNDDMALAATANANVNIWNNAMLGNVSGAFANKFYSKYVFVDEIAYTLIGTSGLNADNLHPNQNGHYMLAKSVMDCVFGGKTFIRRLNNGRVWRGLGTDYTSMTRVNLEFFSYLITSHEFKANLTMSYTPSGTYTAGTDYIMLGTENVIQNYFASTGYRVGNALILDNTTGNIIDMPNVDIRNYAKATYISDDHWCNAFTATISAAVASALNAGHSINVCWMIDFQFNYTDII